MLMGPNGIHANYRPCPDRPFASRVLTNSCPSGWRCGWKCIKDHPDNNWQDGQQRMATVDGLMSRKMSGRAASTGAVAGDSWPVPANPDRVGTEYPAVFP